MKLTARTITSAKYFDGKRKLFDGGGLYLELMPSGSKLWRYAYRFHGKQSRISLGAWPEVSLQEAREKHRVAHKLVNDGVNPSQARKTQQNQAQQAQSNSLKSIASEWMSKQANRWKPITCEGKQARLERHAFPILGNRPINEISARQILDVLRKIEAAGSFETAHRVKQALSQIFRYAIATDRAEYDPTASLAGALTPPKTIHHAAITEEKAIGGLLRAIDDYDGYIVVKWALQLAPFVFVRPGELRHAEWSEIDTEAAMWRIPADKMKMNRPHMIPLSQQAIAILEEVRQLTSKSRYVFHSIRTITRPISENTTNAALRRMGYTKDQMTTHGFRSMASTRLHELGWRSDLIEMQLSHAERNEVKSAYNYAEYVDDRRKMMQAWADYLDGLKAGGEIIAIKGHLAQ